MDADKTYCANGTNGRRHFRSRRTSDEDRTLSQAGAMLRRVTVYANCFAVDPGRCFRFQTVIGRPERCWQPVTWRGRFRAANGRSYRAEACEEHAGDLPTKIRVADSNAHVGR